MPKWDRKSLYHSHLAREGRLTVKLKSDPIESKFKPGTHIAYLQVEGDETEYTLNLEPETVEAWRRAPKNVWLFCEAAGSTKDAPKVLRFSDEAGPVLDGDDYTPVAASAPPAPLWPEDERRDPVATAIEQTVRAVKELAEIGITVDPSPIYSTHFIQACRR